MTQEVCKLECITTLAHKWSRFSVSRSTIENYIAILFPQGKRVIYEFVTRQYSIPVLIPQNHTPL